MTRPDIAHGPFDPESTILSIMLLHLLHTANFTIPEKKTLKYGTEGNRDY